MLGGLTMMAFAADAFFPAISPCLPCCCLPIGVPIVLGIVILWIWALVDCLANEPSTGNDKLVWALVILLASWLGALIYLIVRRPERMRLYGK
jgi:hypothetical protein